MERDKHGAGQHDVGEIEHNTKGQAEVTPNSVGWDYLHFRTQTLASGETHSGNTGQNEVCTVLVKGDAEVTFGGQTHRLEGRPNVFAGLPYALYLPPGQDFEIKALTEVELGIGEAAAEGKLSARLITPEDVKVEIRGGHNATRQITHILDPDDAEHLLCVEVYTPSGNWSSYPPHKHDVQNLPEEIALDEVYHYRFHPADGWALQRLFTDDRSLDERLVVTDGETVLVREGYHPVVTAPGYDCYYLNFLAGETPLWVAKDEPQLEWVRGSWAGAEDRIKLPLSGTGR